MRLVKDARLSLPLTEVMKIDRFTSPLVDAPHQSSPRPRLRHGRRLALLFRPNLTQKLYSLFFALLEALLPHLPQLFLSQEIGFGLCRLLEISLFRFLAKGPAWQSHRQPFCATCTEESHLFFCSPFSR